MKQELEDLFNQIESIGHSTFSMLYDENYLKVAYLLAKLEDGIADLKKELEATYIPYAETQPQAGFKVTNKPFTQPSGLDSCTKVNPDEKDL